MSIEDPVEYELKLGATQIPANVKAVSPMKPGLRSILRQDPDVIFVAKCAMRRRPRFAIRASLTGHPGI